MAFLSYNRLRSTLMNGMIENVVGVIIWTEDLERLAAFYQDVVGLIPHSVQPTFVSYSFGEMRFSLGVHEQVSGPSRDPYRVMINLGVTEIHRVYERLKERGVAFIRPPEQEHWGGWVATFQDPDGNILQLLQQPS